MQLCRMTIKSITWNIWTRKWYFQKNTSDGTVLYSYICQLKGANEWSNKVERNTRRTMVVNSGMFKCILTRFFFGPPIIKSNNSWIGFLMRLYSRILDHEAYPYCCISSTCKTWPYSGLSFFVVLEYYKDNGRIYIMQQKISDRIWLTCNELQCK